jgi:NAD(P)-dependent dehydrogenase (short-subunit alcohol dehydrogenase family)
MLITFDLGIPVSRARVVGMSISVLVTGSTDGLGRAVALDLARRGATVLVHGRDQERIDATRDQIERETGRPARGYLADFADLGQVGQLAERLQATEARLDVLVNNAGIGRGPTGEQRRELSRDGYELRFAVNYLAPFLLTRELLPLLRRSSPSRVINVASIGQAAVDFDDIMLERDYDASRAYGQSKLALIMATFELAERLASTGVTVNALHPGSLMPTKIVLEAWRHTIDTLEHGVRSVVRLVVDELEGVTGRYFDGEREARAHDQAYDPAARRRLWQMSSELSPLTRCSS